MNRSAWTDYTSPTYAVSQEVADLRLLVEYTATELERTNDRLLHVEDTLKFTRALLYAFGVAVLFWAVLMLVVFA